MKFGELYFHAVAIAVGASFLSGVAFGSSVNGNVTDVYRDVIRSEPHTVTVCEDVRVPVTKKEKGSDDLVSFIVGAAIGSAVGNQVNSNNGSGTIGAIVGGALANEHQKKQGSEQVIGYRTEQVCQQQTQYTKVSQQVYSHSTITFTDDGKTYTVRFTR